MAEPEPEPEPTAWTRERTLALIASLRRKEILWSSASKCYKDRRRKAAASCRRERKKIAKSEAEDPPDEVYEPTWTYWKEFRFWRGLPDEAADPSTAVADNASESADEPRWSLSARRPPRKRKKKTALPEPAAPGVQKQMGDEFDAFGITVAAKLRKMDENQRLYAENIINQTLYSGLTFRLSSAPTPEDFGNSRIRQTARPQSEDARWTSVEFPGPPDVYKQI